MMLPTKVAIARIAMGALFLIGALLGLAIPRSHAGETLIIDSQPGDFIGRGRRQMFTSADGEFTFGDNQRGGVSVFFRTPNFDQFWIMEFSPPYGQTLAVANYVDAIDFPHAFTDQPGLFVAANGYGCQGRNGSFEIKQLRWGPDRTVEAFAAEFEFHCYGTDPALFGEIRFNPAVTLSAPLAKTVSVGQALTFTVVAEEAASRIVTLTATGLPAGATFVDHRDNTATFSWTPASGQGGIHKVRFYADNGVGEIDSGPTRIAVGDILRVPDQLATIQAAIDQATDGYTVLVAPGSYLENINFKSKQIAVKSEQGAGVTVIDGGGSAPVITFEATDGPGSVIDGFTLRNGRSDYGGGGIDAWDASPQISNNIIAGNEGCGGAGISILVGAALIERNTISGNKAMTCHEGSGGGIAIGRGASAQILDNLIANNTALGAGGGINLNSANGSMIRGNLISGNEARSGGAMAIFNQSSMAIVQNVITANRADRGGGLYWLICCNPGPLLVNNTIADNHGPMGSGIFADGWNHEARLINNVVAGKAGQIAVVCGASSHQASPIFQFNNFFSLGAAAYGGVCPSQSGLSGNISADPKFLNPASGDYSLDVSSPSIDAADSGAPTLSALDFAGRSRLVDGDEDGQVVVDMGAYEFFPNAGFIEFASPTFSVPENGGAAVVTVVRRGGKSGQMTIEVSTGDGTATAPADYITSAAVLTFASGETQKTFTVPIIDDQIFEGRESVNLRLDNVLGGAGLGIYRAAVLEITEPGVLSFPANTSGVQENGGCAVLTILRSDGDTGAVTVHYRTEGGTATPGLDYTPVSGTLMFADGETMKTVCIPVLGDALVEGTESVGVLLSDPGGGALLGHFSAVVLHIGGSDFMAADYFPTEPGDTWRYLSDGAETIDITVRAAPVLINGLPTSAFQDDSGYQEFYTADENGVRLHGFFTPRVPIPGLGRVDIAISFVPPLVLAAGVADIGQTVSSGGVARTNELPRIGSLQIPYSADFVVAGFDRITVAAGTFDVVRIAGTVNISGEPPQIQIFELSEGIGIVRSTIMQSGITRTLELVQTNVAPFTVDAFMLPDAEVGVVYRGSLSIQGASPPFKLSVEAGSLPGGLTLNESGEITGMPTSRARSANFTVRVSQNGSYALQPFRINVVKALQLKTKSLKRGNVGKNYDVTLKLNGGRAPYQWSLSGRLPAGLVFDAATGRITGVPVEPGNFPLTVRVADPLGGQAQKELSLTIR